MLFDLDLWEEIWQTINRNRRRSIMTAFGVFWGIFMLTILSGMGLGLERGLRGELGDMAVNSCFFFGDRTSIPYQGMRSGRYWRFENGDMDMIRRQVKGVQYVAGFNFGKGGEENFSRGNKKGAYRILGTMPEYQKINPQTMKYGRYINDIDMVQKRKVCVIGQQVWQDLFPGGEDPVGSTVRMGNMYLTVVGVVNFETGVNFGPRGQMVYLPFSTVQQIYSEGDKFDVLAVTGYDDTPVLQMDEDVRILLRRRHTISPDDTKAIGGFNLGEQFEMFSKLFRGIGLLTWIVGIGTLLAGIVGVSNIMLVVIRERTQEIGVRRALGARPRVIISQIMSESFVLTFVAGIGGLVLAVGLLSLVEKVMSGGGGMFQNGFHAQISFGGAMASMAILVLGGLLAGIIPANRAMRIKPVDAIREE